MQEKRFAAFVSCKLQPELTIKLSFEYLSKRSDALAFVNHLEPRILGQFQSCIFQQQQLVSLDTCPTRPTET